MTVHIDFDNLPVQIGGDLEGVKTTYRKGFAMHVDVDSVAEAAAQRAETAAADAEAAKEAMDSLTFTDAGSGEIIITITEGGTA